MEGAARTHGVDAEVAERVYEMIMGFSGFGFPKAHGAAFGLLAYQSTWLRVHYGPEFLCALLNEQPMGFYASDTLVHEAQRRGIALLRADVNASEVECTADGVGRPHRPRLRQRRARRRGRGAGGGARGRRAVPLARRPRLARRGGAPGARAAGVGGRVRRRCAASTPPAARCCGSSGSPRPASRCRTARSSRSRSSCPARPSCARSSRGRR